MNAHNFVLSSVIFLFYHCSIHLACCSPFAETVSEGGKRVSECWLKGFIHFSCAFWWNSSFLLVDSFFLLDPSLMIFFELFSNSFFNLLIIFFLMIECLQWICFILTKHLDKLILFFFKNVLALLIDFFVLK